MATEIKRKAGSIHDTEWINSKKTCRVTVPDTKTTDCVIPFIGNSWDKKIHRERGVNQAARNWGGGGRK